MENTFLEHSLRTFWFFFFWCQNLFLFMTDSVSMGISFFLLVGRMTSWSCLFSQWTILKFIDSLYCFLWIYYINFCLDFYHSFFGVGLGLLCFVFPNSWVISLVIYLCYFWFFLMYALWAIDFPLWTALNVP